MLPKSLAAAYTTWSKHSILLRKIVCPYSYKAATINTHIPPPFSEIYPNAMFPIIYLYKYFILCIAIEITKC